MPPKQPAVYIMASGERGTLYIGITGDLKRRVWEHRDAVVDGFTKRYGVKQLVWFEHHTDFPAAIAREKQLKKWSRAWKLELIESANPSWRDLWNDLLDSGALLPVDTSTPETNRRLPDAVHQTTRRSLT